MNGVLRSASSVSSTLPALTCSGGAPLTPSVALRGLSPNVAKRAAWSTPRGRLWTPDRKTEQQQSNASVLEADGGASSLAQQASTTHATSTVAQLEDALEVLDAVLSDSNDQSDSARRREAALEETSRLHAVEEQELERTRLAVDEQLHTTLELLQTELARERRLRSDSDGSRSTVTAIAPATTRKSPSKRHVSRLAPRLRNSPLNPRTKEPAPVQLEDREVVEEDSRFALFDRDVNVDCLQVSLREVKLHELREERARWQRDYETMREQVIQEKARQVALFQRLETVRQSHANHLNDAKAALRASQTDVERLQARLAQARINAAHETRRTTTLLQNSKTERQRLVCALAETRHKFREWKEGEAATLRATREQAVHALHTEYELKLARHQEEKQKLRDKVKDLEVSLRLLQRDRQLSPGELSERKGTLLQNNTSAIGFRDIGAADFIEAQGRIHELEALLQLSKERQEQQDTLLHVSETALARLSQERELDALENLSLPSPVTLVMSNLTGKQQADECNKFNTPEEPTPSPAATPPTPDVVSIRDLRILDREGSMAAISVPPSTPNRSLPRQQGIATGGIVSDMEKEILRRKSIALSAEVNRYQKIVVQSMEEVRALKESRRRSRSGSINSSTMALTPREAYLLEELAASQREIDTMKAKLKKKHKKENAKVKATVEGMQNEAEDADSCSSNSSDSDYSSDNSSNCGDDSDQGEDDGSVAKDDTSLVVSRSQSRMSLIQEHGHDDENAAVKVIQTCSRGFLARREFIRKKMAIGKIKARYRGYLVRKNYEALGGGLLSYDRKLFPSELAPHDFLLVTEAMQYKMQIVEPHHKLSYICEGGGCSDVDVVLRVSKDPPILQVQVTPNTPPDHEPAVPRVVYFHLFETIALLPFEDEEIVLETSSEKEIARIFASRLIIQAKGSDSDYHFFIARPSKQYQDDFAHFDTAFSPGSRTLLTELPVQPMETRAVSVLSDTFDASFDGMSPVLGHEIDLDLLIQEARSDPLDSETRKARPVSGNEGEDATARVRRLVKRLSTNAFEIEE